MKLPLEAHPPQQRPRDSIEQHLLPATERLGHRPKGAEPGELRALFTEQHAELVHTPETCCRHDREEGGVRVDTQQCCNVDGVGDRDGSSKQLADGLENARKK
ncbi:MAG: hypothetical protein Q8L48_20205 [Archangium sp.]|nr:hypothetical protein [Archangium sp.]